MRLTKKPFHDAAVNGGSRLDSGRDRQLTMMAQRNFEVIEGATVKRQASQSAESMQRLLVFVGVLAIALAACGRETSTTDTLRSRPPSTSPPTTSRPSPPESTVPTTTPTDALPASPEHCGDLAERVTDIRAVRVGCDTARRVALGYDRTLMREGSFPGSRPIAVGDYACRARPTGEETFRVDCADSTRRVTFDWGV